MARYSPPLAYYAIRKQRRRWRDAQDVAPRIVLSANTLAEDASAGALVGTFSVLNGSGTYTYTLTDTAGNRFAIDGDDLERGATALDYEAATSHLITVEADNGVDDPLELTVVVYVTDISEGGGGGPLSLDFSQAANSGYAALLEDF